jgi:hypothetical protein
MGSDLEDVLLRAVETHGSAKVVPVLLSLFDGALASTQSAVKVLAVSQAMAVSATLRHHFKLAMHGSAASDCIARAEGVGQPMLDSTILLCFLGFACNSEGCSMRREQLCGSWLEGVLDEWLPQTVTARTDILAARVGSHQQKRRTCVSVHVLVRCLKALWRPHFLFGSGTGAIVTASVACSRIRLPCCSENIKSSSYVEKVCCAPCSWASFAAAISQWARERSNSASGRATIADNEPQARDYCNVCSPIRPAEIANAEAHQCMLEVESYSVASSWNFSSLVVRGVLQDLDTVNNLLDSSLTSDDQMLVSKLCCDVHVSVSRLHAEYPLLLSVDVLDTIVEVCFRVLQLLLPGGIPKKALESLLLTLALCTHRLNAGCSGCWMKRSPPFRRAAARACRYLIECRVTQEAACRLYFPMLSESLADNGMALLTATTVSTTSPYTDFFLTYPHLVPAFTTATLDACLREMADCLTVLHRDIRDYARDRKHFCHPCIDSHVIEAAFSPLPPACAGLYISQRADIVMLLFEYLLLLFAALNTVCSSDGHTALLNHISTLLTSVPRSAAWQRAPISVGHANRHKRSPMMLFRMYLHLGQNLSDNIKSNLAHLLGMDASTLYRNNNISGKKRNWSSAIGRKRNPVVAMWQKEDKARGQYDDLEDFIVE